MKIATTPVLLRNWLACLAVICSAAEAAPPADFVFHDGAVYTVTTEQPWAQAVVIAAGRIEYVGTDSEASRYIGPRTRVVDLAGGMLLPGFVDSHAHISKASTLFDAALTFRGRPARDVLVALERYVNAHPKERLIRGAGWILEAFPESGPDKAMLDAIVPDRPAVLTAIDSHHAWVNSKALALAGIDRNTPDPEPGVSWFQRVPGSREPTGFIVEGKAIAVLNNGLAKAGYPLETRERLVKGFAAGLPMLAAAGITTVFDAAAKDEASFYSVLSDLEKSGRLPVRVFGAHALLLGIEPGRDPIREFQALRATYHSDFLSAQMIKIFLDGSENNYTGYMLEPYADRPDTRGIPLWRATDLNDFAQKADAAGIDLHMHVVGDAGVRMGLDAVAYAAARNGPRDRRHTLAHAIFVHPDDIPRFRELGVLWQSTPAWALMSPRNLIVQRAMGEARFAQRIYRFQSALDDGVIVTFGSDLGSLNPGEVYRPLEQIEIGRTRQALGQPRAAVMPDERQRLNVADLIRCYTINGAYMLHMENKIGSIAVGKRADLVLLAKNLFAVSPYEIHTTRVLLTMMDGKVTYRAPPP